MGVPARGGAGSWGCTLMGLLARVGLYEEGVVARGRSRCGHGQPEW